MSPTIFQQQILGPGLYWLEDVVDIPYSQSANRFLLTIMMQESGLEHRYQLTKTPGRAGRARGWAQFELTGGVRGVLKHSKTRGLAKRLCSACDVKAMQEPVWRALEGHDLLAVGFARLLLWTSPKALPTTAKDAWTQYAKDLWRPGKPHPRTWKGYWDKAGEVVERYVHEETMQEEDVLVELPPECELLTQVVARFMVSMEERLRQIHQELSITNQWLEASDED